MTKPYPLRMDQKASQSLKQTQKMIMSYQMQQAIRLLQLPIQELQQLIDEEMEQNPLLELVEEYDQDLPDDVTVEMENEEEFSIQDEEKELTLSEDVFERLMDLDDYFERHFKETENYSLQRTSDEEKQKSFLDNNICSAVTLDEVLLTQAKETFTNEEEKIAAETIIGNLESNGLFTMSLKEAASTSGVKEELLKEVLTTIRGFDPPGIAAGSLRESLMRQLEYNGDQFSLAHAIVDLCFEDLIHNRVKIISKTLNAKESEVYQAITHVISHLDLQPGSSYSESYKISIVPDIQITIYGEGEEEKIQIWINEECVPDLKLNHSYLDLVLEPGATKETKNYIKEKLASAKWLMRSLSQRSDTLQRLAWKLVHAQKAFFSSPAGQLKPMTLKDIAEELELHESTIARAVANKYLSCDRGTFPLKYFFTNAIARNDGRELSARSVKDLLQEMIEKENKMQPLSDEKLSQLLKRKGIQCARRTIAKYRGELNIGNTQQRRQYH